MRFFLRAQETAHNNMLSSHGRARLISDRAAISLAESMSGRRALSARRAFNHNVASLRGGDRTLSSPVAMDYEPSADERAYAKATKSFGKAYKQLLQALDRLETQRQSRQAIGMANDAISDMKEAGMKLAGLDGGLSTVIVDGISYDKGQFAAWFDGVEQKVLQLATTIRQEENEEEEDKEWDEQQRLTRAFRTMDEAFFVLTRKVEEQFATKKERRISLKRAQNALRNLEGLIVEKGDDDPAYREVDKQRSLEILEQQRREMEAIEAEMMQRSATASRRRSPPMSSRSAPRKASPAAPRARSPASSPRKLKNEAHPDCPALKSDVKPCNTVDKKKAKKEYMKQVRLFHPDRNNTTDYNGACATLAELKFKELEAKCPADKRGGAGIGV